MKSTQWIISEIKKLISFIPEMAVRYENVPEINGNFIEITPLEIYLKDEKYLNLEDEITNEFLREFPCEGISFISENAIVPLNTNNILFQEAGALYNTKITTNQNVSRNLDKYTCIPDKVIDETLNWGKFSNNKEVEPVYINGITVKNCIHIELNNYLTTSSKLNRAAA